MSHGLKDTTKFHEIFNKFQNDVNDKMISSLGNGHINDTYLLERRQNNSYSNQKGGRYVLQKINTNVFPNPTALMENFRIITSHIRQQNESEGLSELDRRSLTPVLSLGGKAYTVLHSEEVWRATLFIEKSRCLENTENNEQLFNSGYAYGHFIQQLSSLKIPISNTIDDFHNTPKRYRAFEISVVEDKACRAKEISEEIEFATSREYLSNFLVNKQVSGLIPTRIVHNDAKVGNLLFDLECDDVLCVTDLDTVMSGLSAFDYGEIIRTSVSDSAEDEICLSNISVDFNRFQCITNGFIQGMGATLTNSEIECLIHGAKVMTFENGIRFLTDYLNGDIYFKTHRPQQNLDRCRAQFALLKSIELNEHKLEKIVRQCSKEILRNRLE